MKAFHHKAMFFNVDGCAHRSGDPRKDKYGFEKALMHFCRSGADTLFLLDPRVTAAKIKNIEAKVQEAVPGAKVIFHPTIATPGESEDNSMQCMGGMIIIMSPEWAELKYRSRVERPGFGLVTRLEFSTGKNENFSTGEHKIRIIGAYWPPRSGKTGKGALEARLRSYLSSIGWKGSPHDYLDYVVGKWVSAGIDLGQFVILGGDFNAVMDKAGLSKQPYIRD